MADLLETLKALDPTDDSLWTDDGLPSLAAVQELVGSDVTREAINEVAAGLTRITVTDYVAPIKKSKKAKVEEPVVAEPVVEEPQDELVTKVAALRETISTKLEAKVQLEKELVELNQELFSLEIKLKPVDTSSSNAEALAGYAAAAQAEREERAAKMQKLLDSGLSMKEVKDVLGLNRKRKIEI